MRGITSWFGRRQVSPSTLTGSPYSYSPLEPGQIRLLQIITEERNSGCLYCKFKVVDLDDKSQSFTAISYVWGAPIFEHKIWFQGNCYIAVTSSAAAILGNLAQVDTKKFYWIDAVCINQQDLVERSNQVQLMYSIYSFAEEVLAFPAHQLNNGPATVRFVLELGQWMGHVGIENVTNADLLRKFKWPSTKWTALVHLLEQPFFVRVWIIQEMVAAKHTKIWCGGTYLSWEYLELVISSLRRIGAWGLLRHTKSGMNPLVRGGDAMCYISSIRVDIKNRVAPPPLYQLITISSNWGASDARDRIFALLNISSDASDVALKPDYTKTDKDVFISSTAYLLCNQPDAMCILSAAGIGLSRHLENLPSWVPDWTTVFNGRILGAFVDEARSFGEIVYKACGEIIWSDSSGNLRISYDKKTSSILLKVRTIDEVQHIAPLRPKLSFQPDTSRAKIVHAPLLMWLMEISQLTLPKQIYPTGEICFPDVLATTLVTNLDAQGKKQSTQAPKQFLDFLACEYLMVKGNPYEPGRLGDIENDLPEIARETVRKIALSAQHKAERTLLSSNIRKKYGEAPFLPLEIVESAGIFSNNMVLALTSRRLLVTRNGYLGLGPELMKTGDLLCVVESARVPFLIRPRDGGGHDLVGECYAHGLMHGEGVTISNEQEIRLF